jgi:hypothetical protein
MSEPRLPTDDAGAQTAYKPASPARTGAINVASVDPSITMVQLERHHALVVVRGELGVEFLLSVRQHLTNLVDVGVRYVVVISRKSPRVPRKWSASSQPHVGRCTHSTGGCDRSRQLHV